MGSLETKILGIEFPNPFILAAGPNTSDSSQILDAFDSGWGGAVIKTLKLNPSKQSTVGHHTIRSGRVRWGSVGAELVSEMSLDQWKEEVDRIRESFPKRPLIASIVGDHTPSSWVELVDQLKQFPIDAIEINTGYPIFDEEAVSGKELGQDAEATAKIIGWVRERTNLPVIVKLSPNVTDIIPIANAAHDAGANVFTATSGLSGVAGVELTSLKPLRWGDGDGLAGEYTGPGLRPVALRWTAYIAKSVPKPIIGCGGISTWQDAAEFFTVGASAVQVRNAAIWGGIQIIDDLKAGFSKYLERNNMSSPADLVGLALPKIVGFDELDIEYKMVATLVESECIGCELCARVCFDAGFQAIEMEDEIAKIGYSKCDGCGLCIYVCPPDIMEMVPRDH